MEYIIAVIIWGLIWGFATKTVNENKGYYGGFWLGFLLSFIGFLIVACKPENKNDYDNYESASLLSAAAKEASDSDMIANGGWKCSKCGTINPHYTGTCGCGNTKKANEEKVKAAKEAARAKENAERELLDLQKLKTYKDLLDSGAISQEEFDKKKAELLN